MKKKLLIVWLLLLVLTVKAQQTTWNVKDAPNMIKSLQETPVTNEWMDKLHQHRFNKSIFESY